MVTKQEIHTFLRSVGIPDTGTVLIHTSMRSLGEVEGGCDGLIEGFVSYLKNGLFLIPTHTWANVGEDQPVYDVRSTVPCIGALPSVAAFRSDAVRSLHPTHSVAAFGPRAEAFVQGEEGATSPCPPGGVWARLYDEGATVLLIGVGLNRNTYIHAVDEMLDLPHRLADPIDLTVLDRDGKRHCLRYRKHGEATGSENFGNYRLPLERLGALTYATLGNATVGIFDVRRGTGIIKHLWSVADYDLCAEPGEIPKAYYRNEKELGTL